ncbi:MAG: redox-regulated ATPase YchF [Candidatus Bathyarchaeia archaeon]
MIVGIVGKPNVGKSTFFSAATLIPVEIANYPFTTIKPNRGIGFIRTRCVCKEFNVKDNPSNSVCIDGVRLIPVELVDCAGLVPDAWKGRGLGNMFLDEVRKADALIHIVDAAGATDLEGRLVKPGTHDPLEDVKFLEKEIAMWMYSMLSRDWPKIARTAEAGRSSLVEILEERFSGLSIRAEHVAEAIRESGFDADKPTKACDEEVISLVSKLREVAKPMLIAGNKADIPEAEDNIKRLRELGLNVIPCCAEAELALRRASEKNLISYIPGDCDFTILRESALDEAQKRGLKTIRERVLLKYGSTGVQKAINDSFFDLLDMITVFPVEDPGHLSDHRGRVLPDAYLVPRGTTAKELAYKIHTELGENFVYAIDVRTKRRVGEDYVLKDRDVISVVSAKRRV